MYLEIECVALSGKYSGSGFLALVSSNFFSVQRSHYLGAHLWEVHCL